MCPTRIEAKLEPTELDLSQVFDFERGIGRADLLKLAPMLDQARRLIADEATAKSIASPGVYLDQYKTGRRSSLLGQLLGAAKRMRDGVDQVVVVGAPRLIACAKMLFAACCHPYHNELSRGERGGRPRIRFAPADLDNDALHGLLDLLPRECVSASADDAWGLIVISDDHTETPTAVASILSEMLKLSLSPNKDSARAIFVGSPVAEPGEFAGSLVFRQIIAERCAVPIWDAGVLLAGAVMGMDVVKLLRGGAALYERFLNARLGNNPALDLAGVVNLLSRVNSCSYSIATHDAALRPLANLFGHERGGQQLLVQMVSGAVRRDRIRVRLPADGGRGREAHYLPELTAEVAEAVRTARNEAGQPTAIVRLPAPDEYAIGQLIQLFTLTDALIPLLTAL